MTIRFESRNSSYSHSPSPMHSTRLMRSTSTVRSRSTSAWLLHLEARVQQTTGNVAPVAAVKMDGQRLIVTVNAAAPARPAADNRPAFPGRPELVWELTAQGGKLTGVVKNGDKTQQLTGVRAPALKAVAVKSWAAPEPLFNGKDLSGWEPINNTPAFLRSEERR